MYRALLARLNCTGYIMSSTGYIPSCTGNILVYTELYWLDLAVLAIYRAGLAIFRVLPARPSRTGYIPTTQFYWLDLSVLVIYQRYAYF